MNLTVNGQTMQLPGDPTVAQLVHHVGLAGKAVAVEVNKTLVPRRLHGETQLREGDRIELVTLVGGG